MLSPEVDPPEARERQSRLPIGAEVQERGVRFRVWAPRRHLVEVTVENGQHRDEAITLLAEGDGYFSATVSGIGAGVRYRSRSPATPRATTRSTTAARRS